MDRQQDTSGDYGYDLAHEATGRKGALENRTATTEGERSPADRPAGEGQDLGYDEAHDF